MLRLVPPEAAQPLEHEFFSVIAAIAGTLWVITTTLFTSVPVIRSRLLTRVGMDFVLGVSSIAIVTVSSLFLCGMLLALGELLPPGAARQTARITSGLVPVASFIAPIVFLMMLNWSVPKGRPEPFRREQIVLTAIYVTCAILSIFGLGFGSFFLAGIGTPNWFVSVGLDGHVDSIVLVIIVLGCVASLVFGMVSMYASMAHPEHETRNGETRRPPPPCGRSSGE
jgi:hypothetical protein